MSINFSASHNPAGLTETNGVRSVEQTINPRILSEPVSNVEAANASRMVGGRRKRRCSSGGSGSGSSRKIYPKYMIGRMGGMRGGSGGLNNTLSYSDFVKGGRRRRYRRRYTRRNRRNGRCTRRRYYRGGGCGCDAPLLHGGAVPVALMRGGAVPVPLIRGGRSRSRSRRSRSRRMRRGGGCGCGMPKLMGGAIAAPRALMRGGYSKYSSDIPTMPVYSTGPPVVIERDLVGLANPPPVSLINN